MNTLLIITILSLIGVCASFIYSTYKEKEDIAIGIAIMTVSLIIIRDIIK